jgi:hypothetical protein
MSDPNWFQKKWGFPNPTPSDLIHQKLEQLEEKYQGLLLDVKRLEDENIELTNELYRMENSLDARIDILAEHLRIDYDV